MGNAVAMTLVFLVPLCGVLAAVTPWLMPRGECFAVTVPEAAQADPRLKALKKRYLLLMLAITAVCTVIVITQLSLLKNPQTEESFIWVFTAATMVPILAGFALMLVNRRRVQAIKRAEGWTAEVQLSAAILSNDTRNNPRPLPLAWNLLYIPVLLLTIGIIVALYPNLPDQIPMQSSLSGHVNTYAAKSPATVAFPVYIELFMAVCFAFSHWSILKSKPDVNPRKPATSSYAYATYSRALCLTLLIGGLAMNLVFGIAIPLSFAQKITLLQAGFWVVIVITVFTIVTIVISVMFGQNGSRMFKGLQADTGMPRDEDRFWKLGIFYVNSQDPAFIVPKRFGVGWTVNFARPATWVIVLLFCLITAVFVIGLNYLY